MESDFSQQLDHTCSNTSSIEAMTRPNYDPERVTHGYPEGGHTELKQQRMEWSLLAPVGTWPVSRNLPSVFENYMCTAILKIGGSAAVKLSYPADPAKSCIIFDISATEVNHVAKELFGLHIKDGPKRRRLIDRDGRTFDIYAGGKFRGGNSSKIDEFIGTAIGTAFRASQPRAEELSNGEIVSNSMSIWIWGRLGSPARVKIRGEPVQLWQIGEALWRFLPDVAD